MTYGCHNRPQFKDYHLPTGAENLKKNRIPHVMTRHCNYALSELGKQDKKCNNCNWRQTNETT
jgi:hypothetical protein